MSFVTSGERKNSVHKIFIQRTRLRGDKLKETLSRYITTSLCCTHSLLCPSLTFEARNVLTQLSQVNPRLLCNISLDSGLILVLEDVVRLLQDCLHPRQLLQAAPPPQHGSSLALGQIQQLREKIFDCSGKIFMLTVMPRDLEHPGSSSPSTRSRSRLMSTFSWRSSSLSWS